MWGWGAFGFQEVGLIATETALLVVCQGRRACCDRSDVLGFGV